MKKHTILITGAAGYVGGMLAEQFAVRDDVALVIGLDKEVQPEEQKSHLNIVWVRANTADEQDWYSIVAAHKPDIIVHTAWQIREMYGNQKEEWRWNVDGSNAIFRYAFAHDDVKRLIHFSTASIYGAFKENTFAHLFQEHEPMREEEYIYGVEKRQVEIDLQKRYNDARTAQTHAPQVSVVRPAAITGPRGRFARIRFGLQAALAGDLKGNIFYRIISLMVSFVPATKTWVRQFIHEDDVSDIVSLLAFDQRVTHDYEIFNITPPGEPVYAEQMADITGKRILWIQPWMARLAFFVFWHTSRGKIPNGKGVWRFYCYPIVMDGSKLTKTYGYTYQYDSRDAFRYTRGRYESCVPELKKRNSV